MVAPLAAFLYQNGDSACDCDLNMFSSNYFPPKMLVNRPILDYVPRIVNAKHVIAYTNVKCIIIST